MLLKRLFLRLKNRSRLDYSYSDLFKLVMFRRLYSFINRNKCLQAFTINEIEISELQILVISLPIRTDRRKQIELLFNATELTFCFVDGIHGKLQERTNLSYLFSSSSLTSLSDGEIGCILSHIKSLQLVIKNNYQYCLILEDDVVFGQDFKPKLNSLLKSTPSDFDILYLASNLSLKNNLYRVASDSLYVPLYPRSGQYAYLISNKGAKQILNSIIPIRIVAGSIDTIIGRLVSKRKINAYHVKKNLLKVDYNNESNILNYSRPKKKLHQSEL